MLTLSRDIRRVSVFSNLEFQLYMTLYMTLLAFEEVRGFSGMLANLMHMYNLCMYSLIIASVAVATCVKPSKKTTLATPTMMMIDDV